MSTGTVTTIDSIASLQSFGGAVTAPYNFEVQGYYSPGDAGGGQFTYIPSDTTSPDNGVTVIVDALARRWHLAYQGEIDIRQAGAKVDGSNDDTAAIQRALNVIVSTLKGPPGTSIVSNYLSISSKSNFTIDMATVIKPTGTLNLPSNGLFNFSNCSNFEFVPNIQNSAYTSTINCIRLSGCTNAVIRDGLIDVKYNAYDGTAGIQIAANTSSLTIRGNWIRSGYGVLANNAIGISDIKIYDNEFVGQKLYGSGGTGDAVEANFSSNSSTEWHIDRNTFHGYVASNPGGANARVICVGLSNVSGFSVDDNTFYDQQMEAIHLENGCSKFTVCRNKIHDGVIGIHLNTNSALNQSDGVISDNEINLPPMAAVFSPPELPKPDYGAAILVNVNTISTGYASDIAIVGNKCTGVTGAARGIVIYDCNQFVLSSNHVHGFPRGGFDIRLFPGSTALIPGPQDGTIIGNRSKANGWGFILGGLTSGSTFMNAGPMVNIRFSDNEALNSLFGLDFNSEITTRTGSSIKIPYRDSAIKVSAGDVLCTNGSRGQAPDVVVTTRGPSGLWNGNDGQVSFSKTGSGTTASLAITFAANAVSNVITIVEIAATGVAANGTNPELIIAKYMVAHQASAGTPTHIGVDIVSGSPSIAVSASGLTATFTATFTSGFNNSVKATVTQSDVQRQSTGGVASFA